MDKISASVLLKGLAPEGFADEAAIDLVTTDSREVRPGCIFVAFPGEKFDGHDFAAKALEEGAEYVVLNHPVKDVPEEKCFLCPDSYRAMMIMGANYRRQFSPKVVGVTGSVGKTTAYSVSLPMRNMVRALAIPSRPRATRTTSWACPAPCSASAKRRSTRWWRWA